MNLQRKLYIRCATRLAHLLAPFPWEDLGATVAAGAANSMLGQLLGRSNMNKQNELQRQNMAIQNNYNRQNAMEQGVMRRMAMQGAGLNINSENGSFSPVAASTALPTQAQQNPQAFDPSMLGMLSGARLNNANADLASADARLKNADAALKERELKGRNEADTVFADGNFKARSFVDDDGLLHLEVISHRDKPVTTREGFEAVQDLTRWIKSEIPKLNAERAQSFLQRYVAEAGISDQNLIYKIAHLKAAEFDLLVQNKATQNALQGMYLHQGEYYASQKDLIDLQKEIEQNSNLGAIWEDISTSFKNGDVLAGLGYLLKALFMTLMNNVGFHASFGVSRVKSSSSNTNTD